MTPITVEQAIQLALVHQQAGRLAEAEAIYRRVLELFPARADALHGLGTLACQAGRVDEAMDLIGRAIALDPATAEYHSNLGECYRRAGQWARALASFRRATELKPALAQAHNNLGVVLRNQGQNAEAIAAYTRAIALRPDYAEAHNNLGNALRDQGQLDAAISAYHHAIRLRPPYAEAYSNLGAALKAQNRLDEAIDAYRKAIALQPALAQAHNELGNALKDQGRFDEAIAAYRRALVLQPDLAEVHYNIGYALHQTQHREHAAAAYRAAIALKPDLADAHNNLGMLLKDGGQCAEAVASYTEAIRLRPGYAEAHNNLGNVLADLGRFEEAIGAFQRALALQPDRAEVHNNLGRVLKDQGRLDEAVAAFRHAIQLRSEYAEAHNNLGSLLTSQGRLDEAIASYRTAIALRPDFAQAGSNLLFALVYHPDHDARKLLAEHRRWAQQYAAPLAQEIRPHPNDATPDRRLRVGYVSPDFRYHAVGRLLLPLFSHHDRQQAEIICFSDVRAGDAVTAQLRTLADRWHSVVGLSDPQLADLIRADRVDILVDLALHTARNRLLVFARKPAPIQVTMLGMPATTGLATMDYRLTDPHLDPPGATDSDYTERSIHLPYCYWCYQAPHEAPPTGELPARRNGFITFGCLNQFTKVSPRVLRLWARILQALPASRLVLLSHPGSHLDAARRIFQAAGIAGDRVEFAAPAGRGTYFERYTHLDLSLDPFPYNGHTSSLDSLWMGVPVITLAGCTSVGRGGASILSNVGLPELIARTPEEYVALAVAWAGDLERLAALRAGLRQRMSTSPLMDGKQYAADVEAAFRRIWKIWCER